MAENKTLFFTDWLIPLTCILIMGWGMPGER